MNGGLEPFVTVENGLQETKMKYGTQHMSNYLKKEVEEKKGEVILNTFVNVIEHS